MVLCMRLVTWDRRALGQGSYSLILDPVTYRLHTCVTLDMSWLAKGPSPGSGTISCGTLGKLLKPFEPECLHL